jgi:hypothetical protein
MQRGNFDEKFRQCENALQESEEYLSKSVEGIKATEKASVEGAKELKKIVKYLKEVKKGSSIKTTIENPKDISDPIVESNRSIVEAINELKEYMPVSMYSNFLKAMIDVNHPDEKYRHWAKWKSGVGCTDIAKSENPTWESEYGQKEAQKRWALEGDRIRKQVQGVEKQIHSQSSKGKSS